MNHISINGVRSYFNVVALAPSFCGESSFGVIRDLSEGVHLKCRQFKNGFEKFQIIIKMSTFWKFAQIRTNLANYENVDIQSAESFKMSTFYQILVIYNSLHLFILVVLINPSTLVQVNLGQSGRSMRVQQDGLKDKKWTVLKSHSERSQKPNRQGGRPKRMKVDGPTSSKWTTLG